MFNPLANGRIQGLFNAFECFSSTFQGTFYFQGLQDSPVYSSTFFKPVQTLPIKTPFKIHIYTVKHIYLVGILIWHY